MNLLPQPGSVSGRGYKAPILIHGILTGKPSPVSQQFDDHSVETGKLQVHLKMTWKGSQDPEFLTAARKRRAVASTAKQEALL